MSSPKETARIDADAWLRQQSKNEDAHLDQIDTTLMQELMGIPRPLGGEKHTHGYTAVLQAIDNVTRTKHK